MASKYSLSRINKFCGSIFSQIVVNPAISEKKIVTFLLWAMKEQEENKKKED
jgi:hypothetical protein